MTVKASRGIFKTRAQATKAKKELEQKFPYRRGQLKVEARYLILDK